MTSPWLTVEQACEYLGLNSPTSPVHFQYLCRKGRIKAQKKVGRWMTRIEWLDQLDENPRRGK